jgi:hypothetical protein
MMTRRGSGEARVVIREGRLTLTNRPVFLARSRAASYRNALREAGTVVCDIELSADPAGERELTVSDSIGAELGDEPASVLIEWATLIGCRRVWLPDTVIELDDTLLPDPGNFEPEPCQTCGVPPETATLLEELATMRRRGPTAVSCPACMTEMPQRLARRQERSSA